MTGQIPKPLRSITAADLMSSDVVMFSEDMSLRDAARRLVDERISGAPVVNAQGACVGVLSSFDFMRYLANRAKQKPAPPAAKPLSCAFERPHRTSTGAKLMACNLPLGACSVQSRHESDRDENLVVCNQPHCVFADWQVVEMDELPTDEVRHYMTPDPVTVSSDETIQTLARRMIDARVHRMIVTDELHRPIGVVSSTDILAALSYAELEMPDADLG